MRHPYPAAVTVDGLTKRFGTVTAVDGLSFEVRRGTITGFLGPNGAGKTTTLRMVLGLVRPTSGQALVNGRRYVELDSPARHVGAVLEATGFHPGRTARDHLRVLAGPDRIPTSRVDEVLEDVGLADAARRRVGGFSLGMRQRLGLAGALLGDPGVLILDEPTNGLDPAGVHWLRAFLRTRVDNGGTVLISSHLLAELALSADHVVIIKDGRLVTQGSVSELTRGSSAAIRVQTPQADVLARALVTSGIAVDRVGPHELVVRDAEPDLVGRTAATVGAVVHGMSTERTNLEDAFLGLTGKESVS
jgi:ABC-2 type transport system ATP-binding protein